MRKLLTSLLVFLLAVTSVFGLTGLKSVKAEDSIVNGFEIIGASVRNNKAGENDLTGIRFTTTVSQEAFDEIMTIADGREVKFGTEITDSDSGEYVQNFCYVSTVEGEDVSYVAKGAFKYYASITFNETEFSEDVLKKLRKNELADLKTATSEELAKIKAYMALAYAELLVAKSYYEIEGVRYYTQTLTRSMRMVANYYDKNQEDLNITLPEEFYAKNYFIAGVEKYGYLKENGEVVGVDARIETFTGISYKAESLKFSIEDGLKVTLPKIEEELGETVALYAFDKDNKVTVLNLKYVTDTISTKEDLSKLNVGYTYDQAEYDALETDDLKIAYLKKCQDNPYDYYEGLYVLTNNIDAGGKTGWAERHEAIFATATSGTIGFKRDETNNVLVAVHPNAAIVGPDGESYMIPREGYPIMSLAGQTPNLPYFKKVGFRGTFDGQGYVISNMYMDGRTGNLDGDDNTPNTIYTYYDGAELKFSSSTNTMSAGIFGVIASSAEIKNVAFDNAYVDFGALIGMLYYAPNDSASGFDKNDVYEKGNVRPVLENMYIKTTGARNWGVLFYKGDGVGPIYNNCFFDFTSFKGNTANNFKGTTVLGHTQVSQGNTGLQTKGTNVYIAIIDTLDNGNAVGHGIADSAFVSETQPDKVNWNFDLTRRTTVEELYTATANVYGTEKTMAESFADNDCFVVTDDGKVYWKKLYESSLILNTSSIELTEKGASQAVSLTIGGTEVTPDSVSFDKDIFSYSNGVITVNTYASGTYEATFNYKGAKVVLQIVLPAVKKTAYLQEDGELVEHGLSDLVGKYFTINGVEIPSTMFNGKIHLDLEGVTLPALQKTVAVTLNGDYGEEITFNAQYVTVAIDEAEDLTCFNVGYTYDQAEYDKLTTDTARHEYLAYCEANPFDYYAGYYVLLKDIDASGIVFNHEAVIAPTITDAGFTYVADATNTAAVKSNITAITGAITLGDKTYNIPRAGYPATNGFTNNALDVKVGFGGTFEGNGHIITNLNATKREVIKYYKPTDTTEMTGTAYDVGAGLFGVFHANAVVQNVAFIDLNVSTSGGLSMYAIARSGYASASGLVKAGKRPTMFNIFIKTAAGKTNYGIFAAKNDKVSSFKQMFVVVDALNVSGGDISGSGLNGGVNGGERTSNNAGLNAIVGYTYIAIGSHSLYHGYGNTVATKRWMYKTSELPTTAPTTNAKMSYVSSYKDLNSTVDAMGTYGEAGSANALDDVSMFKAFTETIVDKKSYTEGTYNVSSYWEVHNGLVYWKGAYGYYVNASTDEIEISDAEQTVAVTLSDASGNAVSGDDLKDIEVKIDNADVLEYVDGKVQVKNYIGGTYKLTFDIDGVEIVIPVTLAPVAKTAYLQEDGELIGANIENAESKSFAVNGTSVEATVNENGKVFLDLEGLTMPTTLPGTVKVQLLNAYGVEVEYTSTYVTVAVDEAFDLQQFSTNFTFNQEEYKLKETDEDKRAYLAEKAANPYTHYTGYIVLTKDIDATGLTFYHDAAYAIENTIENIGFTINEVGNTLTVKNALAQDYDGDGTVSALESEYYIPRPGYPATKSVSSSSKAYDFIPGAFFYKIGFRGTFDGQGHVISNINAVNAANIEYYVGTEVVSYSGYGAGIFGVINAGTVIKNVALDGVDGPTGPVFALVDIEPTVKGTASYHYDEDDVFQEYYKGSATVRTTFSNIYARVTGDHASGTLYRYNAGNRGAKVDTLYVDGTATVWADGAYGSQRDLGYIGGSYPFSTTNGSLCHQITNVYIVSPYDFTSDGITKYYVKTDGTEVRYSHLDIVMSKSYTALFTETLNNNQTTRDVMSVRYNGKDYWTILDSNEDGVNEVYWHSLAPQA